MMISVHIKDSVLTTESSTNIIDLKPKLTKVITFSIKNVYVLYF